jgi:hypothetical protein
MSNTQIPEINKAMREMGQNIASEIDRLQTENEARKARERVLVDALMRAQQIEGMTLRDYFAAKALQGYLASCPQEVEPVEFSVQISRDSYLIADAMLEARK